MRLLTRHFQSSSRHIRSHPHPGSPPLRLLQSLQFKLLDGLLKLSVSLLTLEVPLGRLPVVLCKEQQLYFVIELKSLGFVEGV